MRLRIDVWRYCVVFVALNTLTTFVAFAGWALLWDGFYFFNFFGLSLDERG